ncbi:MAG TPA: hypothetical protein VF715_02700 [Thermoleophilaceae bacterium]|jgi:Flp pilus assembly protein TadB
MGRKVLAPDGRKWKVGRDWFPRRVRRRWETRDGLDVLGDLGFDLDIGPFAAVLAVVFVVIVLVVVILPLLALAVEVVIVILAALAALAARLLRRRPWRLVARSHEPYDEELDWHVVGWRESGEAIDAIRAALEAGREPRLPAGVEARLARRSSAGGA